MIIFVKTQKHKMDISWVLFDSWWLESSLIWGSFLRLNGKSYKSTFLITDRSDSWYFFNFLWRDNLPNHRKITHFVGKVLFAVIVHNKIEISSSYFSNDSSINPSIVWNLQAAVVVSSSNFSTLILNTIRDYSMKL